MNFLITGIGGPTPRSIAGQLRKIYPDAILVGVDSNPKALGFYMNGLLNKGIVIPRADHDTYWDCIKRIVDEYSIDMAFIQPEKEVLVWGHLKEQGAEWPCPALIPPLAHAEALVDKAAMANLLENTTYIPKTISFTPANPKYEELENEIGYPCWIRASVGSGGLGSLKLNRKEDLKAWLFIHKDVKEFTVSEFLTGRHLANQMLYIDGQCIKNAGLHCVEYVMADIAPSKVTGNTSYGKFINEDSLLEFCEEVMKVIAEKTGIKPHGVYSFDLKEDAEGNLKVTEINIRHMAYTGILSEAGFDLVGDTVKYINGESSEINRGRYFFDQDYVFLRDVDIEPLLLNVEELKKIN